MIGLDVLATYLDELAHRIAVRRHIRPFNPLRTTPWIAMSTLQKAIRRGQTDLALQAAASS